MCVSSEEEAKVVATLEASRLEWLAFYKVDFCDIVIVVLSE